MPPHQRPPTERIVLAIGTRDRAEKLRNVLLPSLRGAVADGFRVVVVDQSVGPQTRICLAGAGVEYLRSPPGLARARNAAIAATDEPLIAFTDDDVAFPRTWLPTLVEVFDRHPEAGVVCGRAVTVDGRLLPGGETGEHRWPTTPFQLGSGFNMAFRREAIEQVGRFDEDFGAGARFRAAEDTDMFHRVLRAGWSVVCTDEAPVVHDDGRGAAAQRRVHRAYGFGAGAQAAKHLLAGDRAAGGIAVRSAAGQARWTLWNLITARPVAALNSLAFLLGQLEGFARALPYLRQRDPAGGASRPWSSSRRA